MGFFDTYKRKQRAKEAAKQLWVHIRAGAKLEVPLSLKADDITLLTIAELQKEHPGVELRMYQSRGLILGLFDRRGINISEQAFNLMKASGHIKESEPVNVDQLIADHEAFLVRQGLDPQEMEKEAQEADMAKHAISVGQTGTAEPVTPPESEPETP